MMNVLFYEEIPSTQAEAIKMVQSGQILPKTLLYTNKQTNGTGRSDTTWIMTEKSVAMSFIFQINNVDAAYSLLVAYIILDIFRTQYGVTFQIKWPNDLYLNGKKVGGIITNIEEKFGRKYCISGIGINLVSAPKPLDADYQVTSVLEETGISLDSEIVAKEIAHKIFVTPFDTARFGIMREVKKNLFGVGKNCICSDVPGVFMGIDENGCALLKDEDFGARISSATLIFVD